MPAKKPFDDATLPLTCGKCGHKTRKTFAWAKRHNQFQCPRCGTETVIDASQFRRGKKKFDKDVDDLRRKVAGLNKTFRF